LHRAVFDGRSHALFLSCLSLNLGMKKRSIMAINAKIIIISITVNPGFETINAPLTKG
jgi:hypothetical protein